MFTTQSISVVQIPTCDSNSLSRTSKVQGMSSVDFYVLNTTDVAWESGPQNHVWEITLAHHRGCGQGNQIRWWALVRARLIQEKYLKGRWDRTWWLNWAEEKPGKRNQRGQPKFLTWERWEGWRVWECTGTLRPKRGKELVCFISDWGGWVGKV